MREPRARLCRGSSEIHARLYHHSRKPHALRSDRTADGRHRSSEKIQPEKDRYRARKSDSNPTPGALHQDSTPLVNNLYAQFRFRTSPRSTAPDTQ